MALSADLENTETLIDYVIKLEKRIEKLEQYNRAKVLQWQRVKNRRKSKVRR